MLFKTFKPPCPLTCFWLKILSPCLIIKVFGSICSCFWLWYGITVTVTGFKPVIVILATLSMNSNCCTIVWTGPSVRLCYSSTALGVGTGSTWFSLNCCVQVSSSSSLSHFQVWCPGFQTQNDLTHFQKLNSSFTFLRLKQDLDRGSKIKDQLWESARGTRSSAWFHNLVIFIEQIATLNMLVLVGRQKFPSSCPLWRVCATLFSSVISWCASLYDAVQWLLPIVMSLINTTLLLSHNKFGGNPSVYLLAFYQSRNARHLRIFCFVLNCVPAESGSICRLRYASVTIPTILGAPCCGPV